MPRFLLRDFGTCLFFDGSASYINKSSASVMSSSGGYSIEFWVRSLKTNITDDSRIYSEGNTGNSVPMAYFSARTNGKITVGIRNDANSFILAVDTTNTQIFNGVWHHIVFTDNNGTCVLYIDGVADASNFNYTQSTTTLNRTVVGCLGRNTQSNFFKGFVDEVRTWQVVLTSQQVKDLYYQSIKPSTPYFEWLFDEGSGVTISDNSGNGRTGDMTGHTATYSGDVFIRPRFLARDFGTSLIFNSAHYVRRTSPSVFGSTGYSIEAWVKAYPLGSGNFIYAEGNTASNNTKIGLRTGSASNPKSVSFFIRNDAGTTLVSGDTNNKNVLDGNWHQIVWTDNNGTCAMYIDSILDTQNFNYTFSGVFSLTDTAVGAMYGNGAGGSASSQFQGKIDQVRTYTTALTQNQITALYFQGLKPSTPYFEWLFDEGTGTTINDTSGNSRGGTSTNPPSPVWSTDVPCKNRTAAGSRFLVRDFGSCLSFGAGASDKVTFTVPSGMSIPSQFTVAMWVKFRNFSTAVTTRLFDPGGSASQGFQILYNTGTSGVAVNVLHSTTSGAAEYGSDLYKNKDKWRRLLFTWDDANNTPTLYLDGALYTPTSTTSKSGSRAAWSGVTAYIANRSSNDRVFSGKIDEFCYWDRILTSTEIANDYYSSIPTTNLVLRYKMDEGSGTSLTDSGSSGTTGTITGATYSTDVPCKSRVTVA